MFGKKPENSAMVSPVIVKDRVRQLKVMDELFKTSGVFSKPKNKHHRKKSRYWCADQLLALMGSVSTLKPGEDKGKQE